MKIGDLVKLKLPSARGLYLIIGHGDEAMKQFAHDKSWLLMGQFYALDYETLEMLEKWLEIVSEAKEN